MLTRALREIYHTNLGVKKNEKVLVFTDRPSPSEDVPPHDLERWERLKDIALLMEETGRGFTKNMSFGIFPSRKGHGIEPPESIWRLAFGDRAVDRLKEVKLLKPIITKQASMEKMGSAERIIDKYKKDAVNAVIALSNYSTSHTRFRDLLNRICGTRYASMPLCDVGMFEGAMNVNWIELAKRTRRFAALVNKAETVKVRAANGTKMTLSKKGRKALTDTGILTRAGSFGNLPAGEVFFAPVEGTANGKLVIEWAPTHKLDSAVTVLVQDGSVVDVIGDDPYAELLHSKIDERPENRNIAELGIGTNDMATRPDNILESEKILGTIHIAFGDNSSFGGNVKTPFHQDFVFFRPTIELVSKDGDKKVLIKNGKFLTAS
ncbi:MAG: aminopeptidase [Nitrospirota bacterium]|nr:MAG: aminopeptidase [Nitrospirota bacterium]